MKEKTFITMLFFTVESLSILPSIFIAIKGKLINVS